jgi:lysylphosphatidylglycerol synthetase-like protein (DUF2156 family)
MLMAGLALLQATRNLTRRKELAWYVATIALAVSLLLHIAHAFDLHHSLVAGLLLFYLIRFRKRFYARSDPASIRLGFQMALILGAVVFLYGYIGLHHLEHRFTWGAGNNPMKEAFNSGILVRQPNLDPNTADAARFLGSLQIAGWLTRLYLLVLFLRPVILRRRMEELHTAIQRIRRPKRSLKCNYEAIHSARRSRRGTGSQLLHEGPHRENQIGLTLEAGRP